MTLTMILSEKVYPPKLAIVFWKMIMNHVFFLTYHLAMWDFRWDFGVYPFYPNSDT